MSNVRAEVLRVSRSRSGWRDGTQKPSSQRPFISALKSTFEGDKQKGDVASTGAIIGTAKPDGGGSGIVRSASDGGSGGAASAVNVKPQRLGGTKVSTIANMFQSLTPSTTPTATTPTSFQQKEYEELALSSRPSSKMESAPKRDRREASSPCSSSSSSSSSLTTEKSKPDRGCRDRGDGGVHLNRTESHLARFNNARAMFERLEEESKKSKGHCGWSPAVPKKRSGSMSPSRPSSAISPPQTPRSPSPKRESPLSPREKSRSADCILEDRPSSSSRICRNGRRQLYDDHHEDELCVRIDHNEESSQSSAQSPVYTTETDSEQRTVNGTLEREEQTSGDGGLISAPVSAAECKRSSVSSPQTRSTKIPIPQAAQQLAETDGAISSSRSKSAEDKMTKSHIPHLQRAPYSPKASARSSVIPDSTVTSAVVVNNVPKVQELVSKGTTTKPSSSSLSEDIVDLNGHGSEIYAGEVDTVLTSPLQQNSAKDSKSNGAHWDHQQHHDHGDDESRIVHHQKEEQEPEEEDLLRISDGSIEVVYTDLQTSNRSWSAATTPLQTTNREGHLVLQARRSWDRTPNTLDLGCFADEGTRVDPEEDEIENTETPALPTPPANGSLREEENSVSAAKDQEGGAAKCSVLQDEAVENVTSAIIQQANDVPTQTAELESTSNQQPPLPKAPPQSDLELASEPEVMTPEEASRLLSRNWRPEFLSDEEASEVTMLLRSQQEAQNEVLLLQHQARHQSDSEVGDIEAEPTESYEYEAEFEESVEEAEAEPEAEGEGEREGEVGEEEEGVHYLDDGHFWVEMPGLIASDEEDVDMFVATVIRPKKRERVKFSTDPIRVYSTFSVQDYDRRNDDVDPVSASAEYELEKRVEKMDVFPVELVKGPEGLGLSIIGMGVGADAGLEKLGIFVKTITEGGAAFKDERINVNDQIIEVDGKSLVGVTQAYAASVLRNTSGLVRFLIGREKDGENSEVAQLISQSLQADREREERRKALDNPAESSTTTREGGAAGLTLPIPSLSAQLPPASSLAASAVMVQEDMTPEEGEDGPTCEVFDIEDESSESPSPESDVTSLRIKLKEAQYKNAVAEAELAKAKTKVTMLESMDTEREDYEKKLQSLSVRLVDVERALEAAKKDVMTYQDMLVESQGQYIILEKKYYKAKKLIKEFQQREQDFLHREEYHVQQLQEKDQEYNALVKSLKDRVIQLEQDLMETQRAVGLPVKLPYDNTTIKQLQLTPQQMRKPQGHNQAANTNMKSLETDISDCELSDADLAKYDLSPDSDDTEKTSTVERKPMGNTDPFEKAVPQTELLDSTAAKAKAELATKGSLANRQPPSLKKGSSTGSSGSGTPPTDRKLSDGNVSLGSSREDLDDSQITSSQLVEDSPQHHAFDSPASVIEEQHIRREATYNGATIVTAASTGPINTTTTHKMLKTVTNERIAEVTETRTASSLKIDQGFANELKVVLSRVTAESRKGHGDGSASGIDDNATKNTADNVRHSTPSPSSATSSSSSNFADAGEALPKMIEVTPKRSSQIDPVTGEVIHTSRIPLGDTSAESGTGSTGSSSGERRPYQWQSCSVTDWSSAQVGQWLLAHNLEQYITAFIDGNVNGRELLQMDSTKLKSLGVSNSSDRSALKKKVKELKSLFEKERKAAEKEQKQREKHLKKTEKASKKK